MPGTMSPRLAPRRRARETVVPRSGRSA